MFPADGGANDSAPPSAGQLFNGAWNPEIRIFTPSNEPIIKKKLQRAYASQPFSNFVYPLYKLNFTSYEKNT
jgi:hypothetical protein